MVNLIHRNDFQHIAIPKTIGDASDKIIFTSFEILQRFIERDAAKIYYNSTKVGFLRATWYYITEGVDPEFGLMYFQNLIKTLTDTLGTDAEKNKLINKQINIYKELIRLYTWWSENKLNFNKISKDKLEKEFKNLIKIKNSLTL